MGMIDSHDDDRNEGAHPKDRSHHPRMGSTQEQDPYKMPVSFRALERMVSFTAAKTVSI